MPASASSRAVPPVETISTPSSLRPRAKSTRPRLSEVVSSARRTRTAPGSTTSGTLSSVVPTRLLVHDHATGAGGIDAHAAGSDQPHGLGQQPVLDLVDASLHSGDVARIRNGVEGFLEDDRAAVDVLVDVVDRDPHHAHAVVERLLDRMQPPERGEERRVHVEDAAGKAAHERLAEEL